MSTKILGTIIIIWFLIVMPTLANDLALGKSAKVNGPINIPLIPPSDFNFKPKDEIFRLRIQEISKHRELLTEQYMPSDEVFGQVADRKPWWGLYGGGYYGPGQNSIKGPAEESRFILNPFLLVGEATICVFDKNKYNENDFINHKFPMFYKPSNLIWWPKENKAEVTYQVSVYRTEVAYLLGFSNFNLNPHISLEAINARDLGLKYFYIPPQLAYNVNIGSPMHEFMAVPQFVHCGNSCGYPGGCNNMSPKCAQLGNLNFIHLPARISILFWKEAPKDLNQKADMIYTVNYR